MMFPISIRSRIKLPRDLERWIHAQLGAKLDHASSLIQRSTVRFEDLNGPKGGIDIACRIDLAIRHREVVHAEERAGDPRNAFAQALRVVVRTLGRARDKYNLRGNRRSGTPPRRTRATAAPAAAAATVAGVAAVAGPEKVKRARKTKATTRLEESRTKPSRKSTRKSANRAKPSQGKERTAVARSLSPSARASRRT